MRDVTQLPKAHLHVHLESTVRWATLHELAAANDVPVPRTPPTFADFREFGDYNATVRACLRRPEDFTRVAREFCADEAAQGTRYVEVTFTAAAHGQRLGQPEMPLEAVLEGLAEGQKRNDIECRVLLDHSRRRPVTRAWHTLDLATRYGRDGVIGIGLAGEEAYPLEPFTEVCAAAKAAGVRLVHHAGEACGPSSMREAIALGHAERLGHGIRALEDHDLISEIQDRWIPLEVCPSSNIALRFAESLATHPLPRLRAAGLPVTVNTDIPSIIGMSLTEEFVRVRDAFGYADEVLAELSRTAVDASFATAETKQRVHGEINAWLSSPPGSA